MRVLVVILFAALTTVGYSGDDPAAGCGVMTNELISPSETDAQSFIPFWKKKRKKKVKKSNRMKKNNRRMGKNFKRKNDDTLRR